MLDSGVLLDVPRLTLPNGVPKHGLRGAAVQICNAPHCCVTGTAAPFTPLMFDEFTLDQAVAQSGAAERVHAPVTPKKAQASEPNAPTDETGALLASRGTAGAHPGPGEVGDERLSHESPPAPLNSTPCPICEGV